jgi:predicted nucleotidyltransferase
MMRKGCNDFLEIKALTFINLLKKVSGVAIGFFGIHGSLSLGTHHEGSDIDISVYGTLNFNEVKRALKKLEREGELYLKRGNLIDAKRLNRGIFGGVNFVVNATKKFSEIVNRNRMYRPLGHVELECKCVSAKESIFRPAIYKVSDCVATDSKSFNAKGVSEIVSMIGMYRGSVTEGERIKASGMLEEVTELDKKIIYRVVVGSSHKNEYLKWPES